MQQHKQQSGFTLIEMIVSLGVFSVVVTISVGALLVLIATNRQLQDEQNILTNLSFAIDSMTREIRTGTHYFCETHNSTGGPGAIFDDDNPLDGPEGELGPEEGQDCPDGRHPNNHRYHGVAFIEGGDSLTGTGAERILYFYDQNDRQIYRRVGSGDAEPIVSEGVRIVDAEFFVSGSDPLLPSTGGSDDHQPTVTIYIAAAASADAKVHHIQTTVTQRTLDI